jgi:hypothetical protein
LSELARDITESGGQSCGILYLEQIESTPAQAPLLEWFVDISGGGKESALAWNIDDCGLRRPVTVYHPLDAIYYPVSFIRAHIATWSRHAVITGLHPTINRLRNSLGRDAIIQTSQPLMTSVLVHFMKSFIGQILQ